MVSSEAKEFEHGLVSYLDSFTPDLTLAEARARSSILGGLGIEPGGLAWSPRQAGRRPALVADPGDAECRVVLYLHGGGFTSGGPQYERALIGRLALEAHSTVIALDYRLAPEHPFPAALDDAVTAYQELLDDGYLPSEIALAGCSAGGGLAVSVLVAVTDAGLPIPATVVAFSPWADLAATGASMTSNENQDVLISLEALAGNAANYAAGRDLTDPLLSPLYGDYVNPPPTLLQVGGNEMMLDDSVRLAARLREAGGVVELNVVPGMQHVFQLGAGRVPEADVALAEAGAWLRSHLTPLPATATETDED
jgi:acetyl esterase/lipase